MVVGEEGGVKEKPPVEAVRLFHGDE